MSTVAAPVPPAAPPAPPTRAVSVAHRGALEWGAAAGFAILGGILLLGYAMGDKGFAYIKPPGPIFLSEVLLVIGVVMMATRPEAVRRALSANPAFAGVALFILIGVLGTIQYLPTYGIDAVRDSALYYYSVFAFVFATFIVAYPRALERGLAIYAWFLPVLLLWLPFGAVLARRADLLVLPEGISLLASKSGNTAVHAVIGLGFVLMLGRNYFSKAACQIIAVLAFIAILVAASQARGGMLGSVGAFLVILAFLGKPRGRTLVAALLVGALLITTLWVTDVSFTTERGREVSVSQLAANASSIIAGGESDVGNLGSTADWRRIVWGRVIRTVTDEKLTMTGVGFGRNMGDVFLPWGVVNEEKRLRSPHNSHLDVWARMGWIGFSVWVITWLTWFVTVGSYALKRLRRPTTSGRLAALCLAGALGILINATVDPTMEGPQVAIWAWFLFGLGAAVVALGRQVDAMPLRSRETVPRRSLEPGWPEAP